MKLTIERDALMRALGRTTRIVPSRTTIPVLGNVLLSAHDGRLNITATDLDIWISDSTPADIEMDGRITAPGGPLHDIVRKLSAGGQITLDATGSQLRVQSGRSRFLLQMLPPDDYPGEDLAPLPYGFRLPGSGLTQLISKTKFAISTEETRYYLNGIYLHPADRDDKTFLRAVATDGHRLALADITLPEGAAELPGIIVPRKAVMEIAKICEGADYVEIAASNNRLRIEAGNTALTTKLINGTYPDYQRVIPEKADIEASVEREVLSVAVSRVTSVSNERGRAVKFSFSPDGLTLSALNPEVGEARDEVDAEASGEIDIGFNGKYMAEALGVLAGETLQIGLTSAGGPATLRDPGDTDALIVLMPMRV
ncbi:DNA polymerase III subunit beta [Pseudochelatococcus sp. G4_1912]|uniref:DNA polymerase III subunit beta n=1 Tax=Pseudochelatococcus sp. G4_1912 TaxID=3114288 RepID=UPI0039C5C07C